MASPPTLPQQRVVIIGPKFGTASEATDMAIRNHAGNENVQSFWYEEAACERRIGRFIGRVIRVVSQAFPIPQRILSLLELVVGTLRFRRSAFVAEQLAWAHSKGPTDHLLLVKPMFLRRNDLFELRRALQVETISIVLWDALWRTPSIKELVHDASFFSTEPTDCEAYGFTLLPVPHPKRFSKHDPQHNHSPMVSTEAALPNSSSPIAKPVRMFFCGSWSLDRWLAARRLISAIRQLENGSSTARSKAMMEPRFDWDIHLVTTNKVVSWFTKLSGLKTTPVKDHAYSQSVAQCDVLLDLGRSGQSSPSERVAAGIEHGKVVLSTNPYLRSIGFPFISVAPREWNKGLLCCEQAVAEGISIKRMWDSNKSAKGFSITLEEWTNQVFQKGLQATHTYNFTGGGQNVATN